MPAFIRGEGCLVNASDVQEIHHSGAFNGTVGLKTAVANTTHHGIVVARLAGEEKWNGVDPTPQEQKEHEATAAEVAEALAAYVMTYANDPGIYVIAFNADKTDWWDVSNQQ